MSAFEAAWLALIVGGGGGALIAKIHFALAVERIVFAKRGSLARVLPFAVSSAYEPEVHGPALPTLCPDCGLRDDDDGRYDGSHYSAPGH